MLYSVYVGNVSPSVTEQDLHKLFGACGVVVEIYMSMLKNGQNFRYAFVRYKSRAEGEEAVSAYNNWQYRGRVLHVQWSDEQRHHWRQRSPAVLQQQGTRMGFNYESPGKSVLQGCGMRSFVDYEIERGAETAVQHYNGWPLGKYRLKVHLAEGRGGKATMFKQREQRRSGTNKKKSGWPTAPVTKPAYEPRPLKHGVEEDPRAAERLLTFKMHAWEKLHDVERVELLLHKLNNMDVERPAPFRKQESRMDVLEKLAEVEKLCLQREKEEAAAKATAAAKKAEINTSTVSSGYDSSHVSPSLSPQPAPSSDEWDSDDGLPSLSHDPVPPPPPVTRLPDQSLSQNTDTATDIAADISQGLKRMDVVDKMDKISVPRVGRGMGLGVPAPLVVGRGAKLAAVLKGEAERVVGHSAPAPILPLGRSQRIQMLYGKLK